MTYTRSNLGHPARREERQSIEGRIGDYDVLVDEVRRGGITDQNVVEQAQINAAALRGIGIAISSSEMADYLNLLLDEEQS